MAIQEIKTYRQQTGNEILKIFLKPTKKFTEGNNYFYADARDIDLVNQYSWYLHEKGSNTYVIAGSTNYYSLGTIRFHRELAYKYLGYYPDYIDHENGVEFDNTDKNLSVVSELQNAHNRFVRGYAKLGNCRSFQVTIHLDNRILHPYNNVRTEVEACQLQYLAETDYLRGILKDDYYMYDFLKDRRNDLDIVDLERTGVVSEEEATYRHVIRYAKDNAWYYYRYNLEQYFRDNHIPVPDFDLDEQGFMIDKITRKKLCPLCFSRRIK